MVVLDSRCTVLYFRASSKPLRTIVIDESLSGKWMDWGYVLRKQEVFKGLIALREHTTMGIPPYIVLANVAVAAWNEHKSGHVLGRMAG